MAAPQASSRLKMLQARFQQKQLQEKEQKLLQLYDQQQLRAYQVVQRGSAGSNASSHSSTISQHTISKTASSNSHTTSTSQGGKVRQMFDERRQTSVKGIDRSYPLEPLENKPRKQANGNAVVGPRNGNLTVNRQSVTVKRVTRSDVNSNVNGGKPIHSYHEEITRENYGPPLRHEDEDEFSNENHVASYSNGNHRLDGNKEVEIVQVLDEDTIQRNRMMAKIHLMNYDETLKHRVRNDLESEEFPEELMVDVPDKLPKRTATKKLTQAEARLERFKNANAKRSNLAKNTSMTLPATKKRSEPMFPAKSTSRESKVRKREVADRRLDSREKSPRNAEVRKGISEDFEGTLKDSQRIDTWKESRDAEVFGEPVRSEGSRVKKRMESDSRTSGEAGKSIKSTGDSLKFHCREIPKTATAMKIDSVLSRTPSPKMSAHTKRLSDSPEFFRKGSEKSAPTTSINLKNHKSRPLDSSEKVPKKYLENTRFYSQKYERSTTPDIKSKIRNIGRVSPESTRSSKSISPQYFAQSEKSATTIMVMPETIAKFKTSPEPDKKRKQQTSSSPILNKSVGVTANPGTKRKESLEYPRRNVEARNLVSEFFARESKKCVENKNTKNPNVRSSKAIISRSSSRNGSPVSLKDIRTESPRSRSPQYHNRKSLSSNRRMDVEKKSDSLKRSQEIREDKSSSPEFFCYETEKSATTVSLKPKPDKNLRSRSDSPRTRSPEYYHTKSTKSATARKSQKLIDRESSSPEFFCYETDKSATTVSLKPNPDKDLTDRSASPKSRSPEHYHRKSTTAKKSQKLIDMESSSPEFFCYETDKSATTVSLNPKPSKDLTDRSASPKSRSPEYYNAKSTTSATAKKSQKLIDRESSSPEFFCYETDKSATSVSLKPNPDKDLTDRSASPKSRSPEYYHRKTTTSKKSEKLTDMASSSPKCFCYETDKSATTVRLKPKPSKDLTDRSASPKSRSPEYYNAKSTKSATARKSQKLIDRESSSPEFFCYETDKSATTVSLKPNPDKDLTDRSANPKSQSPEYYHRKITTAKKSEKLTDMESSSPEFFCYETDKSATTVSLNPKPSKDLTDRSASPKSRSPEYYNAKSTTSATARKSQKLIDIESSSPKFFCYETDKSATTVRLKPKPHKDLTDRSASPKSRSPEYYNAKSTKSATARKSQKLIDIESSSPEFFCYETDTSATTVSLKSKPDKPDKSVPHSASPELYHRKSTISPTAIEIQKKSETPRKSQKLESSKSSSPEFFCYDTDKSATTVILQPTPDNVLTDRSANSRNRSPEYYHTKSTKSSTARKSQKLTDKGSSSPEFFCYESDKFATTVSVKPKHSKDSPNRSTSPRSESPQNSQKHNPKSSIDPPKSPPHSQHKLPSQSLSKSYKKDSILPQKLRTMSKTPERPASPKNTKPTAHSGSSGVLRSIKLIRDAIKHQSIPKTKSIFKPHAKTKREHGIESGFHNSKTQSQSPKNETESFDVEGKKGTTTPTDRSYDLHTPRSSPKSSTSNEVDTEIQEIIIPHEYAKKSANRGAERSPRTNLRETYTRSTPRRESQNSIKSKNSGLFTYSVRKPCKNRVSLLESNIFVESNAGGKEERSGSTGLNVENEARAGKCEGRGVSLNEIMSRTSENSSAKKLIFQSSKERTERTVNRATETKKKVAVGRKEVRSPNRLRVKENQGSPKKIIHTSTVRKDGLKGSPTRTTVLRNSKKEGDTLESLRSMELVQKATNERKSRTEIDSPKIRAIVSSQPDSDKCRTDEKSEGRIARKRSKEIDDNEEVAPVKMNKPIDSSDESVKGELKENFPVTSMSNGILDKSSHERSKVSEAKFTIVNAEKEESRKDYGRTDSVESALRRFDSIGMEYGPVSLDNIVELNRESPGDHPHSQTTENGQTSRESDDTKERNYGTETSLRRISDEQTFRRNLEGTSRKSSARESQKDSSKIVDTPCRSGKVSPKATRTSGEQRTGKRFARTRDSTEMGRNNTIVKSPACKRRLFLDTDSGDVENLKTKCSLKSVGRKTTDVKPRRSDKDEGEGCKVKSVRSKRSTSKEKAKELVNDVKSTGVADRDGSPLVKQLRSIEDIRKSFEKETFRQIGGPCLATARRSLSKFATVDKISRSSDTNQSRKSRLNDNVEDKRSRTLSRSWINAERSESRKERTSTASRLKVRGSSENKKVPASAGSRLKVETSTRSRFQIDSSENRTLQTSTRLQLKVKECSMNRKEQAAGRLIVNVENDPERGKKSALKRSQGISGESSCEKSSNRCSKLTTGFSRVTKSPSPDPGAGKAEVNGRARRSVPTSPIKSPDTAARRPSAELRTQNTKWTKRSVPTRSTETIGNRKTTASTTARKSTDVVDGAILENGLHLRDQAGETKYDNNDSSTTTKGDAFVVDFDEQPRENEGIESRKPLLRRQSVEKQTSPTQGGRPPSSVSTVSSGSSTQSPTSGSKVRMASRAKTAISGASPAKGSASAKSGANICTVENLVPCKICGRRFAQERVSLHEQICSKSVQKKRKQFDTTMYRVRGTDLEPFVKKGVAKKQNESKPKKPEVKSNWRRKHEDFINAIRSAKQVQAHLAAGGKLSDLPPPPVSDTSDYIQCPHCGRKFNQAAAERHIPKCEHMLHNKPTHSRTPKPKR